MTPPVGKSGPGTNSTSLSMVALGCLMRCSTRVAQLLRVVRGDAGRHADGDARGAVGQQVREVGGQDDRLGVLAVEGSAEIDGLLVDALQQGGGRVRQPRLGVAVGGGVIAVDVAEVALAVDQRIALGEVLGEAHERVVDGLVAVRMELADDVADHAGAFLVGAVGVELQLAHGVQDAPVHGLEAVAHVGQRAAHDGGERVGEIALLQGILELDGLVGRRGRGENRRFGHGVGYIRRPACSTAARTFLPPYWVVGTPPATTPTTMQPLACGLVRA